MSNTATKITKRKDITEFLGKLLERNRLRVRGKYWAKEVTIDYGSINVKRVDYMQFEPAHQMSISGIESGIFICYEIKSCKADYMSGFGKNFLGEKNYLVMPMSTYKELAGEIPQKVGVMVPVPEYRNVYDEFENPTELTDKVDDWKLNIIKSAIPTHRKRGMVELLFCMLRSGH